MSKEQVPDYSGFPITKLPPGRAVGAGDLQSWAHNRALGRSGVDSAGEVQKVVNCPKCKGATFIFAPGKLHIIKKYRCRKCGRVGQAKAKKTGQAKANRWE